MKKPVLLLIIAFLSNTSVAQVKFCAPGAEWRNAFKAYLVNQEFPGHIYYTHDSLVGTDTTQVLKYTSFYKNYAGEFFRLILIKQKGDTVFMRNTHTQNTWQILYNFAATPGQSWITTVKDSANYGTNYAPVTHTISVYAVSTVTINSMPLKKLSVVYRSANYTDSTEIIERIGCTKYLFNYVNRPHSTDYEVLEFFYCYKDNSLGTVDYFTAKTCGYPVGIAGNKPALKHIKLYPQPASTALSIELDADNPPGRYDIKILNLLGQTLLQTAITNSKTELNISTLSKGVYMLQLTEAGKLLANRKIIKE